METKFYWHLHHGTLIEPLTEPLKNRIKYIKIFKSAHETREQIDLRLRLIKKVKGKLPREVIEAGKAYVKAQKLYTVASLRDFKSEERKVSNKEWEVFVKARKAKDKALKDYRKEIELLHAKECPNCPWNGKTIFTGEWDHKQDSPTFY